MRILLTNVEMDEYSGTTLYTKELALGLFDLGHDIEVFTFRIGAIGQSLIQSGIAVKTTLGELSTPDIIHAHNNLTCLALLRAFKNVPVVFWIHNRLSPLDIPPLHKNIVQYMAVDDNCKERYTLTHGFEDEQVKVIGNWVNLDRFFVKDHIREVPKKALVFSNYASNSNYWPEIQKACKEANLELDVMGSGMHTQKTNPEAVLRNYDLVFAKAKAAMEAMASGCAVIVCDFMGLAGMVTPEKFQKFLKLNFGMKLMEREITSKNLLEEINRYDQTDVRAVTERLRKEANYRTKVFQIAELYHELVGTFDSHQRGEHSFSINNYLQIRRKTWRIWVGLWAERNTPGVHRLFKKLKTII